MAWSFQEYQEFLDAFYQHPEWQDQLRQLILTQELLRLPAGFEELRRAQQLTEQSLRELIEAQKQTEQQIKELIEAQKKSEERLTRLEQSVAELTEAQKRTEQQIRELTEAQKKTEERVDRLEQITAELIEGQKKLVREVGELRGDMLEIRYRQRAFSYLGRIASRVKVVDLQDILPDVEPYLSDEEYDDLLALDMLVSGRLKTSLAERIGESNIWIAIEVSGVVDKADVQRARRRADLLHRAHLKVLPLAAGQRWTRGAWAAAGELGVVLQQDGKLELLEAALEKLVAQNDA
ncbi:MAG: hypothetical protein ACK4VW_05090 [Anaerolineales bacterium]